MSQRQRGAQWLSDFRPLSMRRRMTWTPAGVLKRLIQPCLCLRLMLLGWYSFPRALPRLGCVAGSPQASGSRSKVWGWSHLQGQRASENGQRGRCVPLAGRSLSLGSRSVQGLSLNANGAQESGKAPASRVLGNQPAPAPDPGLIPRRTHLTSRRALLTGHNGRLRDLPKSAMSTLGSRGSSASAIPKSTGSAAAERRLLGNVVSLTASPRGPPRL